MAAAIPQTAGKEAPGLRRSPGYLNMLIRQRNPAEFYLNLSQRYGDVAYFKFGPIDSYLVSHPDLIREVFVTQGKKFGRPIGAKMLKKLLLGNGLLTSEGEFHLRQRRMMQPAFHRQRIAGYARVMVEYAAKTSERWRGLPPGAQLDISHEMTRLTLAVVSKTLFDADVEKDAPEVGAALSEMLDLFDRTLSPLHIFLDKIGVGQGRRYTDARDALNEIIYRIIRERRERRDGLEDRGDLLSMLLLAVDDEGDGSGMTDEQVRDEAMTLFLAGHETTALALTWMWYLLSQHPEAEARLHAELDEVLGDRLPTFEDLPRLRYTEMIMAETLRLYPPAWILGRGVLEPCEIGGYRIPERSTIVISPYVVHRDPRFYPDPLRFDPERWTPEAREARPKFAYFPFGGGNRVCIGEGFAWTEGMLLLATLARRWRLRLAPGHPVEPKAMITLRPKYGMRMEIGSR
ncbi:MAG: cytochrome P450 [Blastocatellia bacterium]|nr:cytochrome P450 [Blastocatellia bacterium]